MYENGIVTILIHVAICAVARGNTLEGPFVGVAEAFASKVDSMDLPVVAAEECAEVLVIPLMWGALKFPVKISADILSCVGAEVCCSACSESYWF